MRHRIRMLLVSTAAGVALAQTAWADGQADVPPATATEASPPAAAPPTPAPAAPKPTTVANWFSTFSVRGQIDMGTTINPAGPDNGINFGHLFTDKANYFLFNQGAITFERDIDPKATSWDFGVKGQVMYGTDARYTHYVGILDRTSDSLAQPDLVEANATIHMPVLTKGGIDLKAGLFVTPLGVEVIDPSGNFFYSHSYLFNFGIPFKHTGFYAVTHVSPMLDIYTGYDTGVNTSLGPGGGFNVARFHLLAGFGLNFSKVTVVALSHMGPELPYGALGTNAQGDVINVGTYWRYLNDVIVTWHINDKLTSISEGNYITDSGVHASGGGFVQYLTYTLTPEITLGMRAEAWRDNNAFWVAAFPGNQDFINATEGLPNTSYGSGGPTTYGAITVGMNLKPAKMPKLLDGLNIRPEVRYDTVLAGGTHPYNGNPGISKSQFTFGIDFIVPFHL